MKDFWLTLEAYVFIWSNANEVLIYNTISENGFIVMQTPTINRIISELQDKRNLYCISINEQEMKNHDVASLIDKLINSFSGNLLDKNRFPQKPIVFIPEANINDDLSREKELSYNPHVFGGNLLRNLTDVTLQLTGECQHNCLYCNETYKQTLSCFKNNGILPLDTISSILEQIKYSSVFELNFVGGDIFSYPFWEPLMDLIKSINCKKVFYTNYSCINSENESKIKKMSSNTNNHLKVLVHYSDWTEKLSFTNFQMINIEYIFIITSENEYINCEQILETSRINGQIIPIYTNNNSNFFTDNVYINKADILSTKWKKNEIFANQYVNTNYFGKIVISSNGNIFTNMNLPAIGVYNNDLKKYVYSEMKEGSNWRKTRSQLSPCDKCIYCFICPPPSNYEIAIGKNNLCNLYDL